MCHKKWMVSMKTFFISRGPWTNIGAIYDFSITSLEMDNKVQTILKQGLKVSNNSQTTHPDILIIHTG